MGNRTAPRFGVRYPGLLCRTDGSDLDGHVQDISDAGARFFSHEPVEPGEVASLTVRVPDGPKVQGPVRVVWSRRLAAAVGGELYSFALGLEATAG